MKHILIAGLITLLGASANADPYWNQVSPYQSVPVFGHVSQNPGSPKHFHPGYGYSIPGFGTPHLMTLPPTYHGFDNGFLRYSYAPSHSVNFWRNRSETPWYLPGASTVSFQRWKGL